MPALIIAVLLYLFPKEVLAEMILVLLRKLSKSTEWTEVDDELVAVVEKRFSKVVPNAE